MRVYMEGVSSEMQYAATSRSYDHIITREGDVVKDPRWWNRGDLSRVNVCHNFMQSECDAVFMVDMDMKFQPNVLEILRAHDLDIVAGHYFKRSVEPMQSIISLTDGTWPYDALEDIPESGLYSEIDGKEIANVGHGNVLIKRRVIEDVIKIIPPGAFPFALGPLPEATNGDYGHFGADYRFFWLARKAGYKIHVDFNEECEAVHRGGIWLDRRLYKILRPHQQKDWIKKNHQDLQLKVRTHGMNEEAIKKRIKILQDAKAQVEAEQLKHKQAFDQLEIQKHVINGQIAERQLELESDGFRRAKLPEYENTAELEAALDNRGKGLFGESEQELEGQRMSIYEREAKEFIEHIDDEHKTGVIPEDDRTDNLKAE